ncbi:MAG TPA: methionyl-tRNA formyltransferase [Patescibacteria group bacterium]
MGTSEFAAEILESLANGGYNIISVYTQPDKKVGRDQEVKSSAVKIFSEKNKIAVFQPEKLDSVAEKEIADQKPDIIILAAYGKIIPKSMLSIPGFGALNIHTSLLPRYRGPSPIQNVLLNGEKETGITIILMDEKIDTGEIISQKAVEIGKDENASELSEKLSKIAAQLLLETLPLWVERKITLQKQDDSKATLCQLIEKSDGKIIWADSAESIYNRYRAFTPWPGIFTFWEKGDSIKRIKLNKISLLKINPETKHHAGEVFQLGEKIGVQASQGVILLEEIQLEGKSSLRVDEFMNGYSDFAGSILK